MEEKYLNEQNWQRFRKVFLIIALLGIGIIVIGIILLISSLSVDVPKMGELDWFEMNKKKSGLRFGGISCLMFGVFMTIVGFFMYFKRQITGAVAQGVMPVAIETINKGATGISPAIQTVTKSIIDAKNDKSCDVEKLLSDAKSLKDRNLITDEEYQQMRKTILGI